MKGRELAESLADEIIRTRKKALFGAYLEKTSKPTKENPIQKMSTKTVYPMLRKIKNKRRKPMKQRKLPVTSEIMKQVNLSEKMSEKIVKNSTRRGCDIILSYRDESSKLDIDSEKAFKVSNAVEVSSLSGKLGYMDREIIKSIDSWCADNSLTVSVELGA